MDEDFAWFINHYEELQEKYGNCFLAVKHKKVLGQYNSYAEGVKETTKTEKPGTFIVQEVSMNHRAYEASVM